MPYIMIEIEWKNVACLHTILDVDSLSLSNNRYLYLIANILVCGTRIVKMYISTYKHGSSDNLDRNINLLL